MIVNRFARSDQESSSLTNFHCEHIPSTSFPDGRLGIEMSMRSMSSQRKEMLFRDGPVCSPMPSSLPIIANDADKLCSLQLSIRNASSIRHT